MPRRVWKTAHEVWPLAALEGPLFTELALPSHFEAAFKPITEKKVAESVICGPDPARHVAEIRRCAQAGYTHVCVHQVGPDQEGFMHFYEREVLPRLAGEVRTRARMVARPRQPASRRAPLRVVGAT